MAGFDKRVAALGTREGPGSVATRAPDPGPEQRMARLVRTIEVEIIPRLVLASKATPEPKPLTGTYATRPGSDEIAELADIVLARNDREATAFVERMQAQGTSIETLYLDLLAPTARRLGDLWLDDACDFTEVTVGTWRLQQVLYDLVPAFRGGREDVPTRQRALLLPTPGEQHTFGVYMIAEFMRRAGWEVWSGPPLSAPELGSLVRNEWFALVGFSLSGENRVDSLSTAIRTIRRTSRNRTIGVMVGGQLFVENPDLVTLVGADATAVDGRHVAQQAKNLLTLLAR